MCDTTGDQLVRRWWKAWGLLYCIVQYNTVREMDAATPGREEEEQVRCKCELLY